MTDLVVVGLGYVGLPLVNEAVWSGMSVVGLDVSEVVVTSLNRGESHVDDISDSDVAELVKRGFVATTDASVVADAGAVVICVPTPLSKDGGPDLTAVKGAATSVAPHLANGALVVLESTTYPGTTVEVLAPILEAGSGKTCNQDFHVAYSPERIDPGNPTFGLRNTPKVVGADHDTARQLAVALYSRVAESVVVARGTREAESAKLLENTYRQVNIALVNEMAKFFHELQIDFWDVISLAATKPFGFQRFNPGPGVGGHCIPIDPSYLSHRVRSELGYGFKFVELAQEINQGMPGYVAQRAVRILNEAGLALSNSRILLLGVAYKPNIADYRESPAIDLARQLISWGATLEYHDPFVDSIDLDGVGRATDLLPAVATADLTIIVQNHNTYDFAEIVTRARRVLDTRGVAHGANVESL